MTEHDWIYSTLDEEDTPFGLVVNTAEIPKSKLSSFLGDIDERVRKYKLRIDNAKRKYFVGIVKSPYELEGS